MPERIRQCAAASYATVPPPAFPPPDPECSSGSIGRPDLRPPSDGRDWGEAHRSEAFLRRSLLPPFSDPAFLSAFPPVPPALLSYPAAPGPATSSASMSVHSSFQNCYASSRSISLAVLIAPSSALITGSLTPSVIGDRPSHPIYRDATPTTSQLPSCRPLLDTVGSIVRTPLGVHLGASRPGVLRLRNCFAQRSSHSAQSL